MNSVHVDATQISKGRRISVILITLDHRSRLIDPRQFFLTELKVRINHQN